MCASREDQCRLVRCLLVHEPVAPIALVQILQEDTEPLFYRGATDVNRRLVNLFAGIHGCPRQADCGNAPCAFHGAKECVKPFRHRSPRRISLAGACVLSWSHQKLVDVDVEDPVSV
eukprot:scaffold516_cov270-Pinguiococcus_pyrenoidosus.AAC.6